MVDNKVYYQSQTPLNQTTQFPTEPTKEGYVFIGCYDENEIAVTEIKEQISKKISLTAKWEIDVESTNFTFDTESGYTITGLKDDTATTIYIPDYVTTIGDGAFAACTSLQNLNFEKNSQLTTIGEGVFVACNALVSLHIPASVTYIGLNYNYTIKEVFYEGTEESAQVVEGLTNFMQSNTTIYTTQKQPYKCRKFLALCKRENYKMVKDRSKMFAHRRTFFITPRSIIFAANVSVFYNIKLSIFFLFFLNRLWYDTNREEKT